MECLVTSMGYVQTFVANRFTVEYVWRGSKKHESYEKSTWRITTYEAHDCRKCMMDVIPEASAEWTM